jgi:uncharacterized cupin superfamily protein
MSGSLGAVGEVKPRETKQGLVHDERGWFVVNAREARWARYEQMGVSCNFEGKKSFPQLGINVNVLQPGESLGRYHAEKAQEDFLVVAGECMLVIDEEERPLRTWDFVHCPPGVPHMIVGAGDGPSVVIAVGARGRGRSGIVYYVSEVARKHGVSVEKETTDYREAYADLSDRERVRYGGWLPEL